MDLERMLERCVAQQWRVEDLNWSVTPRPMAQDEEIAIVQYFKDMRDGAWMAPRSSRSGP